MRLRLVLGVLSLFCVHTCFAEVRTHDLPPVFLDDTLANGLVPTLESFENGSPTQWYAGATIASAGYSIDHHPTDGTKYLTWGSPTTTSQAGSITLQFDAFQDMPLRAIGFYITGFGNVTQPADYMGELTVQDDMGDYFVLATNPPRRTTGNALFFGMVNDDHPFRRITINATTINDGLGLDQVYYARWSDPTPAPEPATNVMLVSLVCLILVCRSPTRRTILLC